MIRDEKDRRGQGIAALFGIIPVILFALRVAPYLGEGIPGIIKNSNEIFGNFFDITLCSDSLRSVFVFLLIYVLCVGIYFSRIIKERVGEEHGSARWGNIKKISKKYADKEPYNNKIMTKNVSISNDTHKHLRNLNTLVCGGSGSGKTRFYVMPNLLNLSIKSNSSVIVLDPKGEILSSMGNYLEKIGYKVRVLNLVDFSSSTSYNPFRYLRSDTDIQKMVTNIFANTAPRGSKSQDPFWDQAAMMLLLALVSYLHYEAPEYEQNFSMVMDMIRAGDIKEDNPKYKSPLDKLFENLQNKNPEHVAVKSYNDYKKGADKTLKSIQISLVTRLEKFNLDSLAGITQFDEMQLEMVGKEKTAIFAVIPDNDSSFNFLIGTLYTQLFQTLFYIADSEYKGELPYTVHFLMDEFANCSIPNDFEKILSTMRSRGIYASIIIQNMAQLKALFDKEWESIVGNCDEFLYLGGNEKSTHMYISEMLGRQTIYSDGFSSGKGAKGGFSVSTQPTGRNLLSADEIRMLDNEYAILFIRGERAVIDKKYNLTDHPNYTHTSYYDGRKYHHDESVFFNIPITRELYEHYSEEEKPSGETKVNDDDGELIVLTDEEVEEIIGRVNAKNG